MKSDNQRTSCVVWGIDALAPILALATAAWIYSIYIRLVVPEHEPPRGLLPLMGFLFIMFIGPYLTLSRVGDWLRRIREMELRDEG
jgi:hypothetical protein